MKNTLLAAHGVLLLDKPKAMSSLNAARAAGKLVGAKKIGHGGTLDPLASGVLIVLCGAATKFAQYALDAHKTYRAELMLGTRTTTHDAEGDIESQIDPIEVDYPALVEACERFVGMIQQLPPAFSALKYQGKALYHYARQGQTVTIEPRQVEVKRLSLLSYQDKRCTIEVQCSKGTYIRSLARDIGECLGCGAYLSELRRIASSPFAIDACISLEKLCNLSLEERRKRLIPIRTLIPQAECRLLDWPLVANALNGKTIPIEVTQALTTQYITSTNSGQVLLLTPAQQLLGLYTAIEDDLQPLRLLSLEEFQSTATLPL